MRPTQCWRGISLILGLIGCTTTLTTQRVGPVGSAPQPGWDYSLPFAQYDITIVRTLETCGEEPTVAITATAVTNFVADPANAFTIDYRSLASATKISNLEIEKYPNGMLKKIGASAEDRTGPVIVNTATALAKIAAAAMGFPSGVVAPAVEGMGRSRPIERCNPETVDALRRAPALRARVATATVRLQDATARLDALTAVASPVSSGADATTQRELIRAARDVAERKSELATATEGYKKVVEQLTITSQLRWPANGDERSSEPQRLTLDQLSKWLKDAEGVTKEDLAFRLETDSSLAGASVPQPTGTPSPRPEPLRYRVPVRARLVMYTVRGDAPTDRVKVITEGPVPQLGRVYLLPLQNKAFQNNELKATFSEDGNLQTAGYAEKSSSAEAATEAFAKVAGMAPQVVRDVRLGPAQWEAAELEAKTKVLENQAKLQTARDALVTSPAEDAEKKRALLASDTALLDAERAKIVAQYLLDKARSDPSSVIEPAKK